jgi:PKD repeat protein
MMFRFKRHALSFGALSMVVLGLLVASPHDITVAAGSSVASLPTDNPANWTPNVLDGQVNAIWQFGNKVVIGGTFTQIADSTVNGGTIYDRTALAAFDATTGLVDANFDPVLDGDVEAIIPATDATTFFVGGAFNTIDGANRRKVAKLRVSDGSRVDTFNAKGVNGRVRDLRRVGNTLYMAGLFTTVGPTSRTYLASLDAGTGAVTDKLDLAFAGLHNGGVGKVIKIDVTPDNSRMLITGNFTSIEGRTRDQVALIDLSTSPATVSDWHTDWYSASCLRVFDSYMRDLDISEDGTSAVIVTTGAYRANLSCDTVSRFELDNEVPELSPTWVSYTGGDTSYSAEIHDGVVYVGGHMRWFNNPFSGDRHGAGGVARPGMGALDLATGLPFSWNPTRDRGIGLFDYHVTPQGIWAGSDTDRWKGERRMKLAFFPWIGGKTVLESQIGDLPADIYQLGRTTGSTGADDQTVLYRVNAGGPALAAADDGPDWAADDGPNPSSLHNSGSSTATAPGSLAVPQIDSAVPKGDMDRPPAHLWTTERWDPASGDEMRWNFPVSQGANITVRIYLANRCICTNGGNERIFDVQIDGVTRIDDLDLTKTVGHDVGTMRSFDLIADADGVDIDFIHGAADNPLVNGIEIIDNGVTASGTLGVQDEVRTLAWDGDADPIGSSVSNTTVPWRTVRGAFMVNAALFTFHADGTIMKRTFNGVTFGPGSSIDGWSNNIMGEMPSMSGIFFDPATSSVYYTVGGENTLYRRSFLPESGILHAVRSTVTTGNVGTLDPARVAGMFLTGGRLYFVDETSGDLFSMAWTDGAPTGSATLEDSTTDWRARALFVASAQAVNLPPNAVIATPTCVENVCEFDGTGSTDEGAVVSHEWDFGDGGLGGSGAATSHTYNAAGSYTVTLTVTDDQGAVDIDQVIVKPTDPPNESPIAVATASCSLNVCSFNGTGSSDTDGAIASYLWYFGDGTTGTGSKPSHAYSASGTYTVELSVTDDDGAVSSDQITVKPTDPPNVAPTAVATGSCSANDCSFNGTGSSDTDGAIASYLWYFGDGTTGTGSKPSHTYSAPGVYTVELIVTDNQGATASDTTSVSIAGTVDTMAPIVPARLLETRSGAGNETVDGKFEGIGVRSGGSVTKLAVTGRGGVPADADGVMLNVTAISPAAAGYLTVYPCGTQRPLASNVNYVAGQVVPNAVLAKIGTGGTVCIYTRAATHLVVDVNGSL